MSDKPPSVADGTGRVTVTAGIVPEADPLWSAFQRFLEDDRKRHEVVLHGPGGSPAWRAFRAGADAELARIHDVLEKAGLCEK